MGRLQTEVWYGLSTKCLSGITKRHPWLGDCSIWTIQRDQSRGQSLVLHVLQVPICKDNMHTQSLLKCGWQLLTYPYCSCYHSALFNDCFIMEAVNGLFMRLKYPFPPPDPKWVRVTLSRDSRKATHLQLNAAVRPAEVRDIGRRGACLLTCGQVKIFIEQYSKKWMELPTIPSQQVAT